METLAAYQSETDDDENDEAQASSKLSTQVNLEDQVNMLPPSMRVPDRQLLCPAPPVSLKAGRTTDNAISSSTALTTTISARKRSASGLILMNNPTKDIMYQPIQGPQAIDPINNNKNNWRGETEINVAYDDMNFTEQRTAFQRDGIANAPVSDGTIIAYRTTIGYSNDRLHKMIKKENNRPNRPINNKDNTLLVVGSDDETDYGIWGPPSAEERYEKDNS